VLWGKDETNDFQIQILCPRYLVSVDISKIHLWSADHNVIFQLPGQPIKFWQALGTISLTNQFVERFI
jgi:hypothetical protein